VRNAGAREVHIVESPVAAAIGISLPIDEPVGSMIVLVGAGTVDIAVMSLSGIVRSKNLRAAGDRLDQDIIAYVKDEFKILLGEKMAEEVKTVIGSVSPDPEMREVTVRGRDLVSGLPREVVLTDRDIKEAIMPAITVLVDSVKEVLETTPPEIVSDVMHRGITLSGGGALLGGLAELLSYELKIPVTIVDDPLSAVVRGEGIMLENLEAFSDLLLDNEDELSPA
jgi:rod shape-determining protein MreB